MVPISFKRHRFPPAAGRRRTRTRAGTSLIVISPEDLKKRMATLERSDKLLKLLVDTLVRRLRGQAKGQV